MAVATRPRLLPLRVMSAFSMATSVPLPRAKPVSAWARAGASLTPSPTMPTRNPRACSSCTTASLASGKISLCTSSMPTSPATAAAVAWLSPVHMTTVMPRRLRALMAAAESGRIGSLSTSRPMSAPSPANQTGVPPSSA